MSLLDMYRRNAERKREEIAKLQGDKSREQKKRADLYAKLQSASQALNSTTSQSTIQSKRRDIERYQKELADIEKKIADIESKIANKYKELNSEEKKLPARRSRNLKNDNV
jgi:chromosome segregation ATPase